MRSVFDKYLTLTEERTLLRCIAKHGGPLAARDHAWIRFALRTGARVETLAGYTVGDAYHALQHERVIFRAATLKGRKLKGPPHCVTLTRERRQAIKDLLKARRAMGFVDDPDAPLVMAQKGRGMSMRSFQARLRAWAEAAGLREAGRVSPHWLRHTCAKRIMAVSEAQDPRVSVMIELGHSSYESTVIYTWPDKESHLATIREAC